MQATQSAIPVTGDRAAIIGITQTAAKYDEAAYSRLLRSVSIPSLTLGAACKCVRGQVVDTDDPDGLHVLEAGALLIEYRKTGGRPFVLDFLFPGQVIVSSTRLDDNEAGTIDIVALEDSSFRRWTRLDIEQFSGIQAWAALQQYREGWAVARNSKRFLSMLTASALERYIGLDDEFPADWRRLPRHMVASYLGITPQYLCQVQRLANSRPR